MAGTPVWEQAVQDLAEWLSLGNGLVVPFVGAGISRSLGLPTWKELADRILNTAIGLQRVTETEGLQLMRLDPLSILTTCRHRLGDEILYRQVTRALDPSDGEHVPTVAKLLWYVNPLLQITTNLDVLLERAGAQVLEREVLPLTPQDVTSEVFAGTEPRVLHLHGIKNRFETWIMTKDQYATALDVAKPVATIFRTLLMDRVLLFVGYSCDDIDFNIFMEQFESHFPVGHAPQHYALVPITAVDRKERLLQYGIVPVEYDPALGGPHHQVQVFLEQVLSKVNPDKGAASTSHGVAATFEFASPKMLEDLPFAARRDRLDREFAALFERVKNYALTGEHSLPPLVKTRRNETLGYLAAAWQVSTTPPYNALSGREVKEEIGRGGFGTVWKVEDIETGEIQALKVAHFQETDNYKFVERFKQGIAAMIRLTNRGVPQTTKYYGHREVPLCVFMEYVDGTDLSRVKDYDLTFDERLRLARDIARVVATAHDIPVYHRDLKPSNVLARWDNEGRPQIVLSDFDLAWYEGAISKTSTKIGDQAFAAPEQLRVGKHNVARAKSDVYGLGMLTFYLLKQEMPLAGQWMNTHLADEVKMSCRHEAKWLCTGGRLAALITQCAKLDPEARPIAKDVAAELEAVYNLETTQVAPGQWFVAEIRLRVLGEANDQSALPNKVNIELKQFHGRAHLSIQLQRELQDSDDRGRFKGQADRAVKAVVDLVQPLGWEVDSREATLVRAKISVRKPVASWTLAEATSRAAEIQDALRTWSRHW